MNNPLGFTYSGVTTNITNLPTVTTYQTSTSNQGVRFTTDSNSSLMLNAISGLTLNGSIDPFSNYYPGLRQIHVGAISIYGSTGGVNITSLNRDKLGFNSLVFSSSSDPGAASASVNQFYIVGANARAGRDTVYIDMNWKNGEAKTERQLRSAVLHELLHENARLDRLAESFLTVLAEDRGLRGPIDERFLDAAEHVMIASMMSFLVLNNDDLLDFTKMLTAEQYYENAIFTIGRVNVSLLSVFGDLNITDEFYQRVLAQAGVPIQTGSTDGGSGASLLLEAANEHTGITTLAENDNGGVALYLNQNGQVVTVAENTRYTDNMLNTYGTE